jgi:hypothetical protein
LVVANALREACAIVRTLDISKMLSTNFKRIGISQDSLQTFCCER